jgi:hypothetical protein
MTWFAKKVWAWSYALEEVRESAQANRQLWSQAVACVGLAILRKWGG